MTAFPRPKDPLSAALFVSGAATTAAQVIIDSVAGVLPIEIACVISSRSDKGGMELVIEAGMDPDDVHLIRTKDYGGANEAFGMAIVNALDAYEPDLIAQLGWLPLMPKNVLVHHPVGFNLHPVSLDPGYPDFGGNLMRGATAVDAFRRFVQYTGVPAVIESTIHQIDPELDRGRLISVSPMSFSRDASTKQIQAALRRREHNHVIAVLEEIARRHQAREPLLPIYRRMSGDNEIRLIDPNQYDHLARAKEEAIKAYPNG